MRKTDKKVDNQLRIALTEICDSALKEFSGFQWLTHLVNYAHFPKSLKVICVFDTNDNLKRFMATKSQHGLCTLIQKKLFEMGININSIAGHISYDTQEDCDKNNNGKWAERLAK
ncbi:MAG TPA: Fis family transcriptional regulator [Psychromonas sp.]